MVSVWGGLRWRSRSLSRRPAAPQPVSSQGYQNNNNNMDGLSSDFTSASPFIAPERVSCPQIPQVCDKHAGDATLTSALIRRSVFPALTPRTAADMDVFPSMFSFYLRGKGRAYVTSLLREKHAWSICFDCGVLR